MPAPWNRFFFYFIGVICLPCEMPVQWNAKPISSGRSLFLWGEICGLKMFISDHKGFTLIELLSVLDRDSKVEELSTCPLYSLAWPDPGAIQRSAEASWSIFLKFTLSFSKSGFQFYRGLRIPIYPSFPWSIIDIAVEMIYPYMK